MSLYKLGKVNEAIQVLGKILTIDSSSIIALEGLMDIYIQTDNTIKAIDVLSQLIELNPNGDLYFLRRAEMNEKNSQAELAIKDYQSASDLGNVIAEKKLKELKNIA